MGDTLKDIPEFFETDLGECVTSRTLALATCRELGPPDLCHVIKTNAKPGVKELGSYHFVLGLDASSSATLAAYLNSLTYLMDVPQGWFAKTPVWRVRSGIYCCYNAFSRVDVRVEVKIPGGVEAYVVNNKAEKLPIQDEHWAETYVSAVIRSLLYSDDLTYKLDGLRYFNIIPDLDSEVKFFEAVETLFWKGHLLGAEADLQFPNNVNNYLTDGIVKYLINTGHYHSGINVFAKLAAIDPEVNSLLARCYLDTDQELLAIQALCDGLQENPSSYSLLLSQTDFLIKKGRLDMALTLARRAVNVAPSEFRSWVKLAEIYVELKDHKSALLTLNSCPMFALTEKEIPKMPAPMRMHFPTKCETILAYGVEEDVEKDSESPTTLARLPGNALKGTFSRAYKLLTLVASKVGWDELLRYRSSSFVMEEEYRMQKSKEEKPSSSRRTPFSERNTSIKSPPQQLDTHETLKEVSSALEKSPDVQSVKDSNKEVEEIKDVQEDQDFDEILDEEPNTEEVDEVEADDEELISPTEPTESPLTQGDDGFDEVKFVVDPVEQPEGAENITNSLQEIQLEDTVTSPILETTPDLDQRTNSMASSNIDEPTDLLDKPEVEMVQATSEVTSPMRSRGPTPSTKFQHKRLCERWLDNLFMVLYEDLRAFTSWRAEMSGARSQRLTYRYSGLEWESLGDLCLRLHRIEEAKDAYTNCVHHRFSPRAYAFLLHLHTKENNLQLTMGALIRLAMYFEKIYSSCQIPSPVMVSMKQMIETHGLPKIQNLLLSLDLAPEVLKVINQYIDIAITFQIKGTQEA